MKDSTIIIGMVFSILMVPFIYMWQDHTGWVQDKVSQEISNYQEPDWTETDLEKLQDIARESIMDVNFVMGGGWDESERYAYRESMYEIIDASFNNPEVIDEKIENARVAYNAWRDSVEYFLSNRVYAMYYTF